MVGAPPEALAPGPNRPPPTSALRAVKFGFQAPDLGRTALYGAVLLLIPIAGPIAIGGWLCEAHQRLVRRHPEPLPRFDFADFGHYLGRGLASFLVGFALFAPLMMVMYAIIAAAVFGGIWVARATHDLTLGIVTGVGLSVTAVVVWLFASVLLNAARTRAELSEDLSYALRLHELMSYSRRTWRSVLVKTIIFGFVSFGLLLAGLLLCYFGLYPAIIIIQIAAMHLRWQIYNSDLSHGGEPIAVKLPVWLPSEARAYQYRYQQQYQYHGG
jgi:hypothetical protein